MNTFGIEQSVASWYGALIMGTIALMSVVMVAMTIVRFKFFMGAKQDSEKMIRLTQEALAANDTKTLTDLKSFKPNDPPVRVIIGTLLENRDLDEPELNELLRIVQVEQRERLNRGLSLFGTFATIGPFIGLFATVLGIIESFHNLAQTGAAGPNVVASGVAAALWGTAAGLGLAIPAVVIYNILNKKAKAMMTDMEIVSRRLMLIFKVNKKSRKAA